MISLHCIKTLIPLGRAPSLSSSQLPKALPPKTLTLEISFQCKYLGRENKHLVYNSKLIADIEYLTMNKDPVPTLESEGWDGMQFTLHLLNKCPGYI